MVAMPPLLADGVSVKVADADPQLVVSPQLLRLAATNPQHVVASSVTRAGLALLQLAAHTLLLAVAAPLKIALQTATRVLPRHRQPAMASTGLVPSEEVGSKCLTTTMTVKQACGV